MKELRKHHTESRENTLKYLEERKEEYGIDETLMNEITGCMEKYIGDFKEQVLGISLQYFPLIHNLNNNVKNDMHSPVVNKIITTFLVELTLPWVYENYMYQESEEHRVTFSYFCLYKSVGYDNLCVANNRFLTKFNPMDIEGACIYFGELIINTVYHIQCDDSSNVDSYEGEMLWYILKNKSIELTLKIKIEIAKLFKDNKQVKLLQSGLKMITENTSELLGNM